MNEQRRAGRGFRSWPCAMTIVLFVAAASANDGRDESKEKSVVAQVPSPPEQQEEGDQASGASSRGELLRQLRAEKSQKLRPYKVSNTETRTRRWEKAKFPTNWLVKGWRGIRPVIGGMPSGSGAVFGGGYIHGLDAQYVQFQINGRYSTRGYTMFDGQLVFPPPQVGRRIEFKLDGAYRDLTSLRFYGLGNDSAVDDRSTYLLRDKTFMGSAWLNPRGLLSFGAQGGIIRARTDSGDAGTSLEENFVPEDVPGFGLEETNFGVFGGWAEFDLRSKWEQPNVGIVFRLTALRYEDSELNRFDFTRAIGDVKAYIPLGPKSRILALRVRAQHSNPDEGHEVPFYLMETIGGANTIRGFREWRFRDRGNLLMSAEYRWEIWTHIDLSFFVDAGKVFFDTDELWTSTASRQATASASGRMPQEALPFAWTSPIASRASNSTSAAVRASEQEETMRLAPRLFVAGLLVSHPSAQAQRFYPDDPIQRDDDSLDTPEKPAGIELGDLYDRFSHITNDFGSSEIGSEARNVNTLDEVPDSNWFTNRHG